MSTLIYRNEIDGLRALAVLPVILFHAGFSFFRGGFIGVDIFFVISGFLITSVILDQINNNHFSFIDFYIRRARRIIPAFYFVLLFSLFFSSLWLMPSDMKSFSKSIQFSVASLANIFFYRDSGYFSAASELKPLLHTWSLSIEEQFYWIFPFFLFFSSKHLNKKFFLFLTLFFLSFIFSVYKESQNADIAFFSSLARSWELLLGVLAALSQYHFRSFFSRVSPLGRQALNICGILFILIPICFFNNKLAYPSFYILIPTLGTAILLIYCNSDSLVSKLLSNPILTSIGLASYSIYLWHQPLFAFARHASLSEPSFMFLIFLAVLSILIGFISWYFIEKPFRDKKRVSNLVFLYLFLGFSSIFIAYSCLDYKNKSFLAGRISNLQEIEIQSLKDKVKVDDSFFKKTVSLGIFKLSFFGNLDSKNVVAIYGDSHAGVLVKSLDTELKKIDAQGVLISPDPNFCNANPYLVTHSPLSSKMHENFDVCSNSFSLLLNWLEQNSSALILALRWTVNLYPIHSYIDEQPFNNKEGGVELNYKHKLFMAKNLHNNFDDEIGSKTDALYNFVQSFNALGKPFYLVYPVPEVGWDVPRLDYKRKTLKPNVKFDPISSSYSVYKERNKFVIKNFDSYEFENLVRVRSDEVFCNTLILNRCIAQIGEKKLYIDDNHLSLDGANLLMKSIFEKF
jgi:peptidoglycan/LPS O-acetylase OafA/YrhL